MVEERAWKQAKDLHQEALRVWEMDVARLKEGKVPKKTWPLKPKCPWKQAVLAAIKLSEIVDDVGDEVGESFDLGLDRSDSEGEDDGED